MTREGGSLVGEGIVQLAHPQPGRQPHADPERLAPRASGTEPARGRPADALTALRTSSSLKTLQEQTIKAFSVVMQALG